MPKPGPHYSYPRPTALPEEVEAVRELYLRKYNVDLPFDDAKGLLEGVVQFIYLTEVDQPLKDAGAKRDPYTGELGYIPDKDHSDRRPFVIDYSYEICYKGSDNVK